MPALPSGRIMDGGKKMNLRSLTMDELTGVINRYPWFGAARKELCVRMSKVGGSEWGKAQYSDAAMYVASRTLISDIVRSLAKDDYSDKDVEHLIKEYINPEAHRQKESLRQALGPSTSVTEPSTSVAEPVEAPQPAPVPYTRTVRVAGGDFFSAEQYASVRKEEDNVFSNFKSDRYDEPDGRQWEDPEGGFCTETLAAIYADQGYFVEAKKIYSRLILRYPEKSAYFASLIEKLQQEN